VEREREREREGERYLTRRVCFGSECGVVVSSIIRFLDPGLGRWGATSAW
jgi:hypothetical protein